MAKRYWCVKCQHGHEPVNGICPCCGADLPNKEKIKEKPQREWTTRGGYTKDTNYEATFKIVENEPESKDLYKKEIKKKRKRKYTRKKKK